MRPGRIRVIDAIPLTTSGKVDHAALAAIARLPGGGPPPGNDGGAVTPAANLKDLIAAQVAEILELPLDEVDLAEDLVVLGGSSLAALELASRLSQQLGHTVDVELVVGSASLAELATRVEGLAAERPAAGVGAGLQ